MFSKGSGETALLVTLYTSIGKAMFSFSLRAVSKISCHSASVCLSRIPTKQYQIITGTINSRIDESCDLTKYRQHYHYCHTKI